MIQEYLFMDATHRDAIEKYSPDKAKVDFFDIENSTCWIAQYTMEGENEDMIGPKSVSRRYAESDGKEAVSQSTNHGFFRGFLGFGVTAAIMA